ncbi:MAG: efflux RND transporter periplasmic adaptor subunit [Thermodesulfobacteriota bacterium]
MKFVNDKRKKKWLIFFIIFMGFILFLGFLYSRLLSVRSEAAKSFNSDLAKPVRVISAEKTKGWVYREVLGRVEGKQQVDIRTNVSGWVGSKDFKRGDFVNKDDVILELYDERTEASLSEAEYNLKSSAEKLKESRRKYNQNKILLEKGIVSNDTMEESENQVNINSANVKSLEASLKRMQFDFDKLKVRSPIEGQIVEIIPDVGQEVLDGEIVAKVVNLSSKRIVAGVDASLARTIDSGLDVELTLKLNGITEKSSGKVVGVSKDFDDNTGVYEVEIKIEDQEVNWWPGEIVAIKFPVKKFENVVKIPRTAVLSDSSEIFVFVVNEGRSLKVPIEITWVDDKYGFASADDILSNSQIITEGGAGLSSGQQVKIIN